MTDTVRDHGVELSAPSDPRAEASITGRVG